MQHHSQSQDALMETNERLARIETILSEMKDQYADHARRLFGNGQPGELDRIRAESKERIAILGERFDKCEERITNLERFRYALGGALFAGSATGAALAHRIMSWVGMAKG